MAELEDAARRAAGGDVDAFSVVVRATSPRLFRLAARLMGSLAEGEDVLQDAYIKAYEALTRGRFDGRSRVDTWLYRVTTNAALDALRARRRRGEEERPEDHEPSGRGDAAMEAHVALRELSQWLADLPDDQRAALVLKELEGLTSAEVADVLGTTEGAIEQRLIRARSNLRRRLHDG